MWRPLKCREYIYGDKKIYSPFTSRSKYGVFVVFLLQKVRFTPQGVNFIWFFDDITGWVNRTSTNVFWAKNQGINILQFSNLVDALINMMQTNNVHLYIFHLLLFTQHATFHYFKLNTSFCWSTVVVIGRLSPSIPLVKKLLVLSLDMLCCFGSFLLHGDSSPITFIICFSSEKSCSSLFPRKPQMNKNVMEGYSRIHLSTARRNT